MVIEENWGISIERMADFLSGQPEILRVQDGFVFRDCRILLTALSPWENGPFPEPGWSSPAVRMMPGKSSAVFSSGSCPPEADPITKKGDNL